MMVKRTSHKKTTLTHQLENLREAFKLEQQRNTTLSEGKEQYRQAVIKLEKDHTLLKSRHELLEKEALALRSLVNASLRSLINKFPSFGGGGNSGPRES